MSQFTAACDGLGAGGHWRISLACFAGLPGWRIEPVTGAEAIHSHRESNVRAFNSSAIAMTGHRQIVCRPRFSIQQFASS
jgi:hypothetical protein